MSNSVANKALIWQKCQISRFYDGHGFVRVGESLRYRFLIKSVSSGATLINVRTCTFVDQTTPFCKNKPGQICGFIYGSLSL